MTDRSPPRASPSRRELLAAAVAGTLAGAIAPADIATAAPAGPATQDVAVLSKLLSAERRLIGSYRAVLASGVVNVVVTAELSGFLNHEQQHLGALERELALRGHSPPPELARAAAGPLATQSDGLARLISAETAAEAAYFEAISRLADPTLVRLAAEILASEAQHCALLRILQNPRDLAGAAPASFVDGSA